MKTTLNLSIQHAAKFPGLPTRAQIKKWAMAALQPNLPAAEVTFRFVDLKEGQTLNHNYRGKDYPTNVLTFVFDEDMPLPPGLPLMGDIVFCAPVVETEAAAQGISLESHYCHLVIHGMLHLQGMDHIEDDEAAEMEALETHILAQLGYPDPYALEK